MKISRSGSNLCKGGVILIGIILFTASAANSSDSPGKAVKTSPSQHEVKMDLTEWKKIVEAAKKEGKIVVSGNPSEAWRKSLVDMFMQEYPEITVEYTGINGRDFWPRVRQERAMGKYLWDVGARGVELLSYDAKRDGLLEPIRGLLLPENADGSKWIGGLDTLFYDK